MPATATQRRLSNMERSARTIKHLFSRVELGDVAVLPDGRAETVRAKVTLVDQAGALAGWVLCGEMTAVLGSPAGDRGPVSLYVPTDVLPAPEADCQEVASGVTRYWAPHLPAVSGAMAEMAWRVVQVRGSVDPIVICWRGPEPVIFVRATTLDPATLRFLWMGRNVDNERHLDRETATVDQPAIVPDHAPSLYETLIRSR